MDTRVTEYEHRALILIRDNGPYRAISQLGFALFAEDKENRKKNPTPQGMALAAGRFVRPLEKKGLIGHSSEGRYITAAGRSLLTRLEAKEKRNAE